MVLVAQKISKSGFSGSFFSSVFSEATGGESRARLDPSEVSGTMGGIPVNATRFDMVDAIELAVYVAHHVSLTSELYVIFFPKMGERYYLALSLERD